MVTYCAMKLTPTCSSMIGQFLETMIVTSTNLELIDIMTQQSLLLGKCWKQFWATLNCTLLYLQEYKNEKQGTIWHFYMYLVSNIKFVVPTKTLYLSGFKFQLLQLFVTQANLLWNVYQERLVTSRMFHCIPWESVAWLFYAIP